MRCRMIVFLGLNELICQSDPKMIVCSVIG